MAATPPTASNPTEPDASDRSSTGANPTRRRRRFVGAELIALLFSIVLVAFHRTAVDVYGWATIVGYGPRWVWLLPPLCVGLVVAVRFRRMPWIATAAAAVTLVLVLGLNLPLSRLARRSEPAVLDVRLITCNVNGAGTDGKLLREPDLIRLVRDAGADVLVLQEWSPKHDRGAIAAALPFVQVEGGLLVASRYPIVARGRWNARAIRAEGAALHVEIDAPVPFQLFAVHIETPRRGIEPTLREADDAAAAMAANIDRRHRASAAVRDWILQSSGPVLVAGDFNTLPDSPLYRRTWAAFGNAFDEAGWGFGGSKDAGAWRVRIDHVLHNASWSARSCRIGPDVGSDHFPVIAALQLLHAPRP